MIRLLPILVLGFKIWMLVDAIRRREPYYWLMIIAFVPFGGVLYFFMVKVSDYNLEEMRERFRRPPALNALRVDLERSPSLENRFRLGEGLLREEQFAEAGELFRRICAEDPEDNEALYVLGKARFGLGDHEAAVQALTDLVERDPAYMDYEAWIYLGHALCGAGRHEEGIASLARLVEAHPRITHQLHYAHGLTEAGRPQQAREALSKAIEDHKRAPRFLKRRNFRLALRARAMLRKLPAV